MRLIDVDNFLKQYSDQVPGDTIDAIDLRLALLKEPKVEAVPVEWIKRWSAEHYQHNPITIELLKKTEVWLMLKDWEEENENI